MAIMTTLIAALALAAAPDRTLLCRPAVAGDQALVRTEPMVEAARGLSGRFLDYPVACETVEEAARAAGRAGLGHGVYARATGQPEGTAYLLVLTTSEAVELARRELLVAQGAEATGRLRQALVALDDAVPRPPIRRTLIAGWVLGGAGALALAGGAVLASRARADAREANGAVTPGAYQAAKDRWGRHRTASGVALSAGGAALAVGLTLVLAF